MADDELEVSSEETSDGRTALRETEMREAKKRVGNSRGPQNTTLPHWHDPVATVEPSGPRWAFKCRYCQA